MGYRRIWGLGAPDAVKTVAGAFEGRVTVDFSLASSYWLKSVMGEVGSVGTDPTTHTYVDTDGDPTAKYKVASLSIENGVDLDTDSVSKYLGCTFDRGTIRGSVNEPVAVSLDYTYADETLASIGIDATPAVDTEDVLVFSHGSVQLPSGTTLARVESFELEIVRNARLHRSIGDRVATAASWLAREWNFRMSLTYENSSLLQDFFGAADAPLNTGQPAGEASLVLTFTNGGAGDVERSLTITLTTTFVTAISRPQRVGEVLMQEVSGWSLGATSIIAVDSTAAVP